MPRARSPKILNDQIATVAAQFAEEVALLVRQNLVEDLSRVISGEPVSRGTVKSGLPRVAKQSRTVPPHCLYPDCDRAHKGPRFSFLCEEHLGIAKAEKRKYLTAWKESRGAS